MVYMYYSFLVHSSADGHLGSFHVLAMTNSAVMNIGVHVSLSDLVSLVCMPRSAIAGSYGSSRKSLFCKDSHQQVLGTEYLHLELGYNKNTVVSSHSSRIHASFLPVHSKSVHVGK